VDVAGRRGKRKPRNAWCGRVAGRKARRKSRDARHGRVMARRGSRGDSFRKEVPAHVAQTGTLTSRGRIREEGWSTLHRRTHS
jgi:hypothetical protein